MSRKVTITVVAIALSLPLGCACGPASDGMTGTVIERERKKTRGTDLYVLTIRRDSNGQPDIGRVSGSVYDACQVGDRWPECKP